MDIRRRMLFKKGISNEGPINIDNYLTIEAIEDGLTASLSINACEYCVDFDGNWKSLSADTMTENINAGQTLSFRGNLVPITTNGIGTFTINKKCNLLGNCMSMLFGDDASSNASLKYKHYAFAKLFYQCTNIITISSNFLPATILEAWCYQSMFWGCDSLITAPELPATTLEYYSYASMFYGCTSLITAPELPATTLAISCYQSMFRDCTSLTTAPELPATILKQACYYSMFHSCTSLVNAPELPASTLIGRSYENMFQYCTKLNRIKMLATDISDSYCLDMWVYGVSSTGTFVKHSNMTTLPTGTSGIPSGWTVVNDGEESGGNLITFTIDGTEYQAEEGMTWEEWVDSEYNVNGRFYIELDNSIGDGNSLGLYVGAEENYVYITDIIQENYNYLIVG